MRKLLFFDLDGTLFVNGTQTFPDSVPEALNRAHEKGHLLFLNTGRVPCHLPPVLDSLPLDGRICGCGASIQLGSRLLRSFSLDHAQSMQTLELFRASDIPAFFEGRSRISFDPLLPRTPWTDSLSRLCRDMHILGSCSDPDFTFIKFFAFTDDEDRIREIARCAPVSFQCVNRGGSPCGWEGVPLDFSKGRAIAETAQALGASIEDCIAFGDSSNDLAMLEACPVSVAMMNAPEHVKKACTLVTDLPEQDGILHAMERLELI